jgi:hypothetical protein
VSFDLIQVHKLKAQGGAAWDEYCRLVAECDASAYDSLAHRALGAFCKSWEQDPTAAGMAIRAAAARAAAG